VLSRAVGGAMGVVVEVLCWMSTADTARGGHRCLQGCLTKR
jgi:hypothetical protein